MSTVWCLSGDILHSVYSEWLEWKDLTKLDIACVEKNTRKLWLTSLTDLMMTRGWFLVDLPRYKMRLFYAWLGSRKVFCAGGLVFRLDVLEDLVTVLDMEYYCPALQSIEIERWSINKTTPDVSHVESNLSVLLSHCHSLQEVTVHMDDIKGYPKNVSDIVLPVLAEKLRENSLVKISQQGVLRCHASYVMVANLLTKHVSTLRDLNLYIADGKGMDVMTSTLIDNEIHLKVLAITLEDNPSQGMSSLTSYLSSAGDLLETVQIRFTVGEIITIDDLMVSLTTSCPRLTRFLLSNRTCSIETLRQLYEQCPHLQDVSIDKAIETDNERKSVSLWVKGSCEDWVACLGHTLRRGQYKQVTLRLRDVHHYHTVSNMKSMLEPYQIDLDASATSETSWISLLQDLPHLNSLHLEQVPNSQYTDAALAVIAEHAQSLTELFVKSHSTNLNGRCFSDGQLSELIKTCQLLTKLNVSGCELESLVAVSNHPSLSEAFLTMDESVSEEMLDGLLLDEMVKWPSTLETGYVWSYGYILSYEFIKESDHWIKDSL